MSSLQGTIEALSKEYLSLNEKLLKSNVLNQNHKLLRDVQHTTERFLTLARASESNCSASEGDSEREYLQQSPSPPAASNAPTSPSLQTCPPTLPLGYVQVWDDDRSSSQYNSDAPDPPIVTEAITLNATPVVTHNLGFANTNLDFPYTSRDMAGRGARDSIPPDSQPSETSKIPAPRTSLSRTMTTPTWTYSIDEKSFSRRLQRASIESAYHLLSDSSLHNQPARIRRAFELTLVSLSFDELVAQLRSVLARSTTESLDFVHTPYLHLGGAGTHYDKGRKENAFVIKPGPFQNTAKLLRADTGLDAGIQFDVDLSKYQGIWLDPNDVEAYLEELGIFINPRAAFAQAYIQEDSKVAEMLRQANKMPFGPARITTAEASLSPTSSSYELTQPLINNASARMFPELGLGPDVAGLTSSMDANDASSWLMGAGDRTPEMLHSGWNNAEIPNVWDPTSTYAVSSYSYTPTTPTAMRKITMDIGNFLNGMFFRLAD